MPSSRQPTGNSATIINPNVVVVFCILNLLGLEDSKMTFV